MGLVRGRMAKSRPRGSHGWDCTEDPAHPWVSMNLMFTLLPKYSFAKMLKTQVTPIYGCKEKIFSFPF